MKLILEMLCSGCIDSNCTNHCDKILKRDCATGLEFEVRCVCNKHGDDGVVL
ncbi:hypothetical protein [Candidatus Nitrosotenuis aquarius]|uniref:hypothetical protein n=1 Tax=Candidatus Nitrosotenuis aquarius TaxID=1846278 RepID=UPI0013C338E3|nr:hypothetical protein [Candidatus Nitrosotenuis aquarius]